MTEKQELWCHNCGLYVQFEIDMELNGNHVLNCPNCDHEHCRVVNNGIITDDRWDTRNGVSTHWVSSNFISTSATSYTQTTYTASSSTGGTGGTGSYLMVSLWLNTTVTQ